MLGGASIYVRGYDSVIAQELAKICGGLIPVARGEKMPSIGNVADRYLFCQGLMIQKKRSDMTQAEEEEIWRVNYDDIARECDRILEENECARICVIGSESAFKGSFNMVYAWAKQALHEYVETKRLKSPMQQLVCVAPTCITGSGMNLRRNADGMAALAERLDTHPKQRWLEPREVAEMVCFLLMVDKGYTTNVVIRMNGGEHCV